MRGPTTPRAAMTDADAHSTGAMCDVTAIPQTLLESWPSLPCRPNRMAKFSSTSFAARQSLFRARAQRQPKKRPYRERAVDLGHRNDISWPLGGVRPYRPYILGARRGVGRPAERAFRLTHVGHLPSLSTWRCVKRRNVSWLQPSRFTQNVERTQGIVSGQGVILQAPRRDHES